MAGKFKLIVASETQTGDIPHIAGALALYPQIHALVLYDENVDIKLLEALYQRAATIAPSSSNDRVHFQSISPSLVREPQKKLYMALKTCNNLYEITDPKSTDYRTQLFKDVLRDEYTKFMNKYLVPVSNTDNRAKFSVLTLTEVTGKIAKAYSAKRLNSYSLAAQGLTYDPVQLRIKDMISTHGKFGNLQLPPVEKPVLLVWARYTGTKTDTGFNPEGDSDPTGQNQLVASATDLGFSVMTVGDVPSSCMAKVVNNATYQLGEFWTQPPLAGKGRAAQCSFFAALMERYPGNLYQIGQKTGAMDFPALLGVPTIYIEDSRISTTATGRVRNWTKPGSLQLYRRLEVEDPPSLPGKGARSFTETFVDEVAASDERHHIGEARWRMAGLLFELFGKWTIITGETSEPEQTSMNDICDRVYPATDEKLKEWKSNINELSDSDCQSEGCIRGYTAADLGKVKIELEKLKTEYSGPDMIIRKSDGTYATRKE